MFFWRQSWRLEQEKAMEAAVRENTTIIKHTSLPKLRDRSINNLGDPAALAIENRMLREQSRRAKEKLEKALDELDRRVIERTRELTEANRKLNELSITDGLTGLFNQRHFLRQLETEFGKALRYGRSLALLLFDIDHFKEMNDRYGHRCGGLVLKNVVGLLKDHLRNSDAAARWGGDELAIILPETDKSKASKVAEKLRGQLGKSSFAWNGESFSITCSIGVAAIPDIGIDDWNAFVETADKSLYRAKREGRNTVVAINSRKRPSVTKDRHIRRQQVRSIQWKEGGNYDNIVKSYHIPVVYGIPDKQHINRRGSSKAKGSETKWPRKSEHE
jgi:diguanylate cyclase (GGDEF)-like protein